MDYLDNNVNYFVQSLMAHCWVILDIYVLL